MLKSSSKSMKSSVENMWSWQEGLQVDLASMYPLMMSTYDMSLKFLCIYIDVCQLFVKVFVNVFQPAFPSYPNYMWFSLGKHSVTTLTKKPRSCCIFTPLINAFSHKNMWIFFPRFLLQVIFIFDHSSSWKISFLAAPCHRPLAKPIWIDNYCQGNCAHTFSPIVF